MTNRRRLWFPNMLGVGLAVWMASAAASAAESYRFTPAGDTTRVNRIEFAMEVGGELSLQEKAEKAGQPPRIKKVPMSVAATLAYDERQAGTAEQGQSWVRYYDQASATLKVDKGGQRPTLADSHRLLAVSRTNGKPIIWAPAAQLTREELDLVDAPANSVLLDELLPDHKVVIGDTWSHEDLLMASLLGIDTVDANEVQSSFLEVRGDEAILSLAGKVAGSVGGVGTNLEVKAKYTFHTKARQVVWFAMAVKEKRSIGHVAPGLDVTAKVTIKRRPRESSPKLTDDLVAVVQQGPNDTDRLLSYESPTKALRLQYDRRWFVTGEQDELSVLRMVDHGELVAQCNLAPLRTAAPEHPPALDQFQRDIQQALGDRLDSFVKARESLDEQGRRVLRVVASGAVSEVPIEWIYYLITDQQGRQATLSFTYETDLAKRFGNADEQLVQGLSFALPAVETAQQPTPVEPPK